MINRRQALKFMGAAAALPLIAAQTGVIKTLAPDLPVEPVESERIPLGPDSPYFVLEGDPPFSISGPSSIVRFAFGMGHLWYPRDPLAEIYIPQGETVQFASTVNGRIMDLVVRREGRSTALFEWRSVIHPEFNDDKVYVTGRVM